MSCFEMTEKRFWYDFEDCTGAKMVDFKTDKEYPLETIGDFRNIESLLNSLSDENEQLKQQINNTIKELQTEKETAISKNERIRLDFAITVLEELKGDK